MIELNKEAKRPEAEIQRSSRGTYTWSTYEEQIEEMEKLMLEHAQDFHQFYNTYKVNGV